MKERIKAWLKANNHSRDWLGEQVGVSKKAVDNWLSSPKEIPLGKQRLIERLMEEDEAGEARRKLQLLPQAQIFSLEVDLPTFRAYSAAALASGKILEDWAIAELNAAAEAASAPASKPATLYSHVQPPSSKVAEPTADEVLEAAIQQQAQQIRQDAATAAARRSAQVTAPPDEKAG